MHTLRILVAALVGLVGTSLSACSNDGTHDSGSGASNSGGSGGSNNGGSGGSNNGGSGSNEGGAGAPNEGGAGAPNDGGAEASENDCSQLTNACAECQCRVCPCNAECQGGFSAVMDCYTGCATQSAPESCFEQCVAQAPTSTQTYTSCMDAIAAGNGQCALACGT
jgi:hypothetical protein